MSVASFHDLPLADRKRRWDGDAANRRVRKWAGAQDGPNDRHRCAFVWYDRGAKDKFGGYKLQIADVIGGELKAVAARSLHRRGGDAGLARRGGPAEEGHRSRQVAPRPLLRKNGRGAAGGGV